jgi:hypothetical protein
MLSLRDEVLDAAGGPDSGGEVFDAFIRLLADRGDTSPGLDLTLHDAVSRRLAWGEGEAAVLAESDAVCRALLAAAQRVIPDALDETDIIEAIADVGCATARIIALASLGRSARERAAQMREELAQNRLRQALERQQEEIERLQAALED